MKQIEMKQLGKSRFSTKGIALELRAKKTQKKQLEAENSNVGTVGKPSAQAIGRTREGMQLNFFQLDDPVLCQVRDEILGIDINNLTPMEALNKLFEIKKIVSGKSS